MTGRLDQAKVAIERILCPVDFSGASTHAIAHATVMAQWCRASITALHVDNPLFLAVAGAPWPENRESNARVTQLTADTAACFQGAGASGIHVDVIVDAGQPAARILNEAIASHADLIVMGTHGASGYEHLLLGSVTEKVLRKAPCPVLTVPPHAQATSRLPYRRLLCAVDFSDSSLRGLDLACSIARESAAALTVLHVIEWPWHEPPPPVWRDLPPDQATALAEFRRYLETSAAERLKGLVPASAREQCAAGVRVVNGKSYAEILSVASEEGADLVVMGVHGRTAADVMLFGSTTNQVVRRATCPVLTLRC
jgi:nucleotide-binding universal stress UspA family protein